MKKEKVLSMLCDFGFVLLFTFPLLLFYEFAVTQRWGFVFWLYFVGAILVGIAYFLYNRGFLHTRVSRNALPTTWSEGEKDAFFEEGKARTKRSKPLLYLLLALALVFLYDMIYLFLWDSLCQALPFLKNIGGRL